MLFIHHIYKYRNLWSSTLAGVPLTSVNRYYWYNQFSSYKKFSLKPVSTTRLSNLSFNSLPLHLVNSIIGSIWCEVVLYPTHVSKLTKVYFKSTQILQKSVIKNSLTCYTNQTPSYLTTLEGYNPPISIVPLNPYIKPLIIIKHLTFKNFFSKTFFKRKLIIFYRKKRRYFTDTLAAPLYPYLTQQYSTSPRPLNKLPNPPVKGLSQVVPTLYGLIPYGVLGFCDSTAVKPLFNKFFLQEVHFNLLRSKVFKFKPILDNYPSSYVIDIVLSYAEYFLNSKTAFVLSLNFYRHLNGEELFLLRNFYSKLSLYAYQFSTIFFLKEFLDIMFITVKLKDFTILISYIQRLIASLTIWNHKSFFRFIFNVFREHFTPIFPFLNIIGMRITIKGKVSVTGNSRKRSMCVDLGLTSISNTYTTVDFCNKILNTNTGVLGVNFLLISK